MKKALTAGLVLAGVLAVSGSALAAPTKPNLRPDMQKYAQAQPQNQRPPMPPEGFDGKRPPMSRDRKPPMPPDNRMPGMSRDKRPPMPPRSGDRKPPEFNMRQPQKGVQPRN